MREIVVVIILLVTTQDKIGAMVINDKSLDLMKAIRIALGNNRELQQKAQYDLKIATSNYQAALADYKLHNNLETSALRNEDKTFIPTTSIKKSTKHLLSSEWNWKLPVWLGSEVKPFARVDLTKTDSKIIQETTTRDKKYTFIPNIGFEWKQPLSPSGIRSGHAPLIQAKASYEIAQFNYQRVKEELILKVITSYYQLVSQKNCVELTQEELKLSRELIALSEVKLKAEQIAKLDLMQVQVQASLDEAKLIAAENSLKNSILAFYRLLNFSSELEILNPKETLVEPVIFSCLSDLSKQEAYDESLKNRIDIKQQQLNINLAQLNLDIQKSKNKPTLTLMGRYQWKGEKKQIESLTQDMDRDWEISARLNFPLLDGGLRMENIKADNLNLEKARYDAEELVRGIRDEIDRLYENIQSDKRRLDILNLNLRLAEESLKITRLKYQQGMETANEVLRSQISFFQIKNSINEVMGDLFINKAKLLKAIGRLEIEYKKKSG